MALGRRLLRVLLAVAVAFAPLGPAAASARAKAEPVTATQPSHTAHHHDHAAMSAPVAVMPDVAVAAKPCHGDQAGHHAKRGCCCDDKASCDASCLQKCFGQAAVMPSERSQRIRIAHRFLPTSVARPPDWRASPHPPPPRA